MNVSRQIGWSNESNLLYQILKQITRLTSVVFGLKPKYKEYTAIYSHDTDGTVTVVAEFENTVGTPVIVNGGLGTIVMTFSEVSSYSNVIGYCYSGNNDDITYQPWLIKNNSPSVLIQSSDTLPAAQINIRVYIKILL
jgi:hypothetical protein